ncbi:MAG: hypothetical protein GY808_04680 [Gammaproteobacteria bacterium]|nr:hypothetical protein [Gammaproteobacteria bacterium]
MDTNFYLLHRKRDANTDLEGSLSSQGDHSWASGQAHTWQTCMREINMTTAPIASAAKGYDFYHDQAAYCFLLEVICGLHSPVIGETEVFGQFKNYVEYENRSSSLAGFQFRQLLSQLVTDAKIVRKGHLIGLGSQSYGSVVRRFALKAPAIHFLGAGILVKDILPWVQKSKADIHIHCRNPQKAKVTLGTKNLWKFHDLSPFSADEKEHLLVVAAPMTSAEISQYLTNNQSISQVIDLRAEGRSDPIDSAISCLDLDEVFTLIETNKEKIRDSLQDAYLTIKGLSEDYFKRSQVRPFGWDDICAL